MEQKNWCLYSLENALEIIFVFDDQGVITYANREAERQLEYEGELCGFSVVDIFPGLFRVPNGLICVNFVLNLVLK